MPRVSKATLEQEFCKLCWWLLERKIAYYRPEAVHESRWDDVITPDDIYDVQEIRYLTLARALGRTNTLVHKGYPGFEDMLEPPHDPMMEIDTARPSVQLAMAKLRKPK